MARAFAEAAHRARRGHRLRRLRSERRHSAASAAAVNHAPADAAGDRRCLRFVRCAAVARADGPRARGARRCRRSDHRQTRPVPFRVAGPGHHGDAVRRRCRALPGRNDRAQQRTCGRSQTCQSSETRRHSTSSNCWRCGPRWSWWQWTSCNACASIASGRWVFPCTRCTSRGSRGMPDSMRRLGALAGTQAIADREADALERRARSAGRALSRRARRFACSTRSGIGLSTRSAADT